jgi:flavorubredoxin
MIKARLEGLKFKFQGDGLRVNFMPTEEDLLSMKNYALQIVSSL